MQLRPQRISHVTTSAVGQRTVRRGGRLGALRRRCRRRGHWIGCRRGDGWDIAIGALIGIITAELGTWLARTPMGQSARQYLDDLMSRFRGSNSPRAGPGPRGGESPAAARGRQAHADANYGPRFSKEFTLPSGRRGDGINSDTRTVIELKPNKPRAIQQGERQLSAVHRRTERRVPRRHAVDRSCGNLRPVSERDEIQQLVDEFARSRGYTKRSGSWFRRQDETIAVLDLQRSDHSHAYYVNVALWLLPLGDATAPKEHTCHVRTRAARLVDDEQALERELDMTKPVDDRSSVILAALTTADKLLAACSTIAGCRSEPGATLVERSLVRGPAQSVLSAS
jgi:hypothetical protein